MYWTANRKIHLLHSKPSAALNSSLYCNPWQRNESQKAKKKEQQKQNPWYTPSRKQQHGGPNWNYNKILLWSDEKNFRSHQLFQILSPPTPNPSQSHWDPAVSILYNSQYQGPGLRRSTGTCCGALGPSLQRCVLSRALRKLSAAARHSGLPLQPGTAQSSLLQAAGAAERLSCSLSKNRQCCLHGTSSLHTSICKERHSGRTEYALLFQQGIEDILPIFKQKRGEVCLISPDNIYKIPFK